MTDMYKVGSQVTGPNHNAIGIIVSSVPGSLRQPEPQYKIAWDCATKEEARQFKEQDLADELHSELISLAHQELPDLSLTAKVALKDFGLEKCLACYSDYQVIHNLEELAAKHQINEDFVLAAVNAGDEFQNLVAGSA